MGFISSAGLSGEGTYSAGYRTFIDRCKNEWEAVEYIVSALRDEGFASVDELYASGGKPAPGAGVYAVTRGRGVCAARIGQKDGFNIVASHIDAPIAFLRETPFSESCGLAVAGLYNRGGLKHYQWTTIPLAIHARFVDESGQVRTFVIGEDEADPVFYINDLSVHLSKKMKELPLKDAVTLDNMKLIMAGGGDAVTTARAALREKYGLSDRLIKTAELYVVPAFVSRDVGLDRSMIAAYGHDDRICAYASLTALLDADTSGRTAVCMFQDKEENGSYGNTSATSRFYRDFLDDIFELCAGADAGRRRWAAARADSWAVTGDVSFLNEPMDPALLDYENSGVMGKGVCVARYSSSTEPVFLGHVCGALDADGVEWQMSGNFRDGMREGSSVGGSFSRANMNIVSIGPGVFGMHSPYELVSKRDLYMTHKAYKTVFESGK